jgi:hypothetical protein
MIRVVHPGSRIRMLTDPGSRGQKGTQSRIPDQDPQHWLQYQFPLDPGLLKVLNGVFFTENSRRCSKLYKVSQRKGAIDKGNKLGNSFSTGCRF